jgi:hypothetical protein
MSDNLPERVQILWEIVVPGSGIFIFEISGKPIFVEAVL